MTQATAPLLLVDIDGVISLFGYDPGAPPAGALHNVEGALHFLSADAGEHLRTLAQRFELVWCSGWEEKANEHLPLLLGLAGPLPFLTFERDVGRTHAHWKLDAIDAFAGTRPLAWIDDALDEACVRWARERAAPTLLVVTRPERGLGRPEVARLLAWATERDGPTG
ncbi:MAG TPA: HAD domain-containing protein [Solirubrobacteraceae bacterium]|jgi:hypothetical protein|nr:HAD domain-containing protein [Solirubrobacteraceae bacterium]